MLSLSGVAMHDSIQYDIARLHMQYKAGSGTNRAHSRDFL
jgi:hypothetical protein